MKSCDFLSANGSRACIGCKRNGSFARVVQQMDIQAVPLTIEQHT